MVTNRRDLSTIVSAILFAAAVVGSACSPSDPAASRPGEPPAVPGADSGSSDSKGSPVKDPSPAAGPEHPAPAATPDEPPPVLLTDQELADGWIALFDGQTLFGWKAEGKADWRVEDQAIVGQAGESGSLVTTSQFTNYALEFDVQADSGASGGICLRSPPDASEAEAQCFVLSIAELIQPSTTGGAVERDEPDAAPADAAWHHVALTVEGPTVAVTLDGQSVMEHSDPKPFGRRQIGLELDAGRMAFRRIKLKPLGVKPLFNGRDLAGWKTYPEMASRFTVTDEDWLNVRGGRGQLETEGRYGDFVLQLECITHAKHLNSGIFFRCIPGDVMMGYECQIHNGFEDGDRRRPTDCGTGGIFRRQDARRVVADDLKWFFLTLVAHGPHMAAWVNGYQVSDWTDTRPPHENPRKGLRVAPGTIMIQGHDETTNISFRNLRISEL